MAIRFQKQMDYQIIFNEKMYYATYYYWKKISTLNKRAAALLSEINRDTDQKTYRYNMDLVGSLSREIAMNMASGLWQGDIVPMGIKLAEEREVG